MRFIDFFKKIIEKNKVEETKQETVAFDEIEAWVENKSKEIKDREKEIFVSIKDRITLLIKGLDEKVKVLENIDMESKKVEDKIKLIVRENLNNYILYLKKLIEKLPNLKEESLEESINGINGIFLDFSKKSYKSYQKVTFLIGKEISDIKDEIIGFSKYLTRLSDENKDIIDTSKTISFIKSDLKKLDGIKMAISGADERIMSMDEEIKNIKETDKKILEEIETIKKSDNYIKNLKKQEEIKSNEKELEEDIYQLKELIDFKALSNVFHVNGEKMDIIKAHKEDFQATFQKSNGADILSLLDEAELNTETISAKLNQISDKKEKIIKNTETIDKNETEDLLSKTREIKLEIEKLDNEKLKELKRCERFKTSREEIINSIEQEFAKINGVVVNHSSSSGF